MRKWIAALLFLVLVALGTAHATTMRPQPAKCPVCTHDFEALVVGSWNSLGGLDSDLFVQAAGEQPVTVGVWTCPKCHYSATRAKFPTGVSEGTKASILAGFPSAVPIALGGSQRQIPAWVKFDLADRVLEMEGAPASERAALNLSGSWSVRSEAWDRIGEVHRDAGLAAAWAAADKRSGEIWDADPPVADDGWALAQARIRSARTLLEEANAGESKGVDPTAAQLHACVRLAQRGEYDGVRPALTAIAARVSAPRAAREAAKALLAAADRDAQFQAAFLRFSNEEIAAGKMTDANRDETVWRMADVQRRLGQVDEAVASYRRAMAGSVPRWLLPHGRELLAALGKPMSDDDFAAAELRLIVAACAAMAAPETAEDAAENLRGVKHAAAHAAIAMALASESVEIRMAGVSALTDESDPGDALVIALALRMTDDASETVSRAAAKALARIGSPAARQGFVDELQYQTEVQRVAVVALGMTGDAASVEAILGAKLHEGGQAGNIIDRLIPIAQLTNRTHESLAAAKEWYAAHNAEDRHAWVLSGFDAAGLVVPKDLWTKAAVPTLIAWIENPAPHVRANALRVLREITGQQFGWHDLPDNGASPRAGWKRALAVKQWRDWWATNGTKGDEK